MYVRMDGWVDGWMDEWMHVCRYAHMHVCVYLFMRVCKYTCMRRLCMYACQHFCTNEVWMNEGMRVYLSGNQQMTHYTTPGAHACASHSLSPFHMRTAQWCAHILRLRYHVQVHTSHRAKKCNSQRRKRKSAN